MEEAELRYSYQMWTALWKLKVLTIFLWKLLNDSLPMQREFAKRNVSLMLLTLYMLQKRAPWTTYLLESTNRHLACRALVWHIRDMGNAWTWQRMCPRSFFFFEKWWTWQDTVGTWPVLPKKKICNTLSLTPISSHFLSHWSPPLPIFFPSRSFLLLL